MRKPNIKSRVIIPHSKECFMRDKDNPWSGVVSGTYWGNFAANEAVRSRCYYWIKVPCNDPNCPGMKAVNSNVLVEA